MYLPITFCDLFNNGETLLAGNYFLEGIVWDVFGEGGGGAIILFALSPFVLKFTNFVSHVSFLAKQ